MSYIERLPNEPISRKEIRQWKRAIRREILNKKTGPVHEFRDGDPDVDGETVVMEVFYRRVKTKVKPDTIVRPFGPIGLKLADESEKTVADFRDQIETFGYSYNKGFDPLTGESLKNVKSFEYYMQKKNDDGNIISMEEKKVPKALDEYETSQKVSDEPEPYGSKRNTVIPDENVYKMLMGLIFDEEFKERCLTAKSDLD